MIEDRTDRTKLNIINWLAPGTFAEYQDNHLAQRCPNTSDWFIQDSKFIYWSDHNATTLFCPGIPGAGKTVLAATVIDYLQQLHQDSCDVAVVYHYYDTKRPNEKGLQWLLASFARQLIQQKNAVHSAATELYRRYHTRSTRPTRQEIQSLFESLLSDYQRVFIIIDALDEADVLQPSQADLLDEISRIQKLYGNVNLMATSRQRPDISARFDSCEQMCVRAHDDDLHVYLDSRMSELTGGVVRNIKLQDEIKEQIVKVADGM